MPESTNVLFLAAEAEPFIKVGGLGDVAGSLPRFLRGLQPQSAMDRPIDVRLVLPRHSVLDSTRHDLRPLLSFPISYGKLAVPVKVLVAHFEGMPVYFLEAEPIARAGSVYSSDPKLDGEKYTFFSMAAVELLGHLNWPVHVVHANDWHTALSCYSLLLRRRQGDLRSVASVLTVHNLPFSGPVSEGVFSDYQLEKVRTGLPAWAAYRPLALGLWAADAIVAVSPSYAEEIQTAEGGAGLDQYLRARHESLYGILNGIDTDSYNPAIDPALAVNYGLPTLAKRAANKAALQVRLGLAESPRLPLLAVVSRLDPQKGIDVLPSTLRRLRDQEWQAIILGTGAPRLEQAMRRLEKEFQGRVRVELRYDAGLARQIYAGADILLMPSRYEPCGLAQMIAMRYGCVPIVSAVGGLKDTVRDGETGFVCGQPTSAKLAAAIRRAIDARRDDDRWERIQREAMRQDFTWAESARKYRDLYQRLVDQLSQGSLD